MANEFADAQLARRGVRGLITMLTMTGHLSNVMLGFGDPAPPYFAVRNLVA
jgi:hypothetical protein